MHLATAESASACHTDTSARSIMRLPAGCGASLQTGSSRPVMVLGGRHQMAWADWWDEMRCLVPPISLQTEFASLTGRR